MRISQTQLRTFMIALALVLSGTPAVLTQATAGQSVSTSEISKRVLPSLVSLTTENDGGQPGTFPQHAESVAKILEEFAHALRF